MKSYQLVCFDFIFSCFNRISFCEMLLVLFDCVSLFCFVLMVPAPLHQANMSSSNLFPTIWPNPLFHFICFHFNYLSTGWKIAAWWGIRFKGEICVQVAQSWPHSLAYLSIWSKLSEFDMLHHYNLWVMINYSCYMWHEKNVA